MPDRRRLKRYDIRLDVAVEYRDVQTTGYVKNLNQEGLFVRADRLPRSGEPVRLRIEASDGCKIEVEGMVRWTTAEFEDTKTAPPGFGVKIEGNPLAYLEFFENLLLH